MPTKEELEAGFRVHLDELEQCMSKKCYWAALHLAIIIPDICGSLESETGKATRDGYKRWCEKYANDPAIAPDEWWAIRCIVLHQGITLPQRGGHNARYRGFSFSPPGAGPHKALMSKNTLNLDVGEVVKQMRLGLMAWFADIENGINAAVSRNVSNNLPFLVRTGSISAPLSLPGFQVWSVSHTTSSP